MKLLSRNLLPKAYRICLSGLAQLMVVLMILLGTMTNVGAQTDSIAVDSAAIDIVVDSLAIDTVPSRPDTALTVADSVKSLINTESAVTDARRDSLERHTEISALDIGRDRGLFILSADKLMEMRIIGSVRALITFNDQMLETKIALNPVEVPTDGRRHVENFYAGLEQTRLGFEVTRSTKKMGDMFLRIEADFAGSDNHFRIRHAYGQLSNFIVGQTWSLFSNVQFLPATVDANGPAGSIGPRTPQVRYYRSFNEKMSWYLGVEYSTPSLNVPDSVAAELLQVIPDFAAKIDYKNEALSFQAAMITTVLSGFENSDNSGEIVYKWGFGGSIAGKYKLSDRDELYFSVTGGSAISHFLDMFAGKGLDAVFDPVNLQVKTLKVFAGYIAFSRKLPLDLSFQTAAGFAPIRNYDFQPDRAYNYSYNVLANIFWQPVDGARLGIEYTLAHRSDKGASKGNAGRFALLMYYDF